MSQTTYKSQRLDHYGIVAGICQQLKIAELIDDLIPSDHRKKSHIWRGSCGDDHQLSRLYKSADISL